MQPSPVGRLLILEDDPSVGNVIRLVASTCGFDARVVTQPAPFFTFIDDWDPTHIALDLGMPEMDGVQVLAKLGALSCRAEIIITSGMGSRVLDAAGRSASEHGLNVVGVLAKPFLAGALRSMLLSTREADAGPASPATRRKPVVAAAANAADLRFALEHSQLQVHYQPKIDCVRGVLAGFEALVRWEHPQMGLIMPEQFIAIAERHGLIDALTDRVLENSLSWFSEQFLTHAGVTLSINLSAKSLRDGGLVERIHAPCRKWGMPAERLIFEVTESSAMEDPIAALDLLTRIRMKGYQLSIDDFGTGYSSMLQLVRMPFSEIKVDKSFVMSATRSTESRAVVKSIVDLGRSMGLRSTAEGIEDAEAMALVKELGCDYAQGYWIGRPMSGDAILEWVAQGAWPAW